MVPSVLLKTTVDYTVYLLVRVLIAVVQAVRIETCQACARGLAILFCDVIKLRSDVTDENLRHAYPKLTAAERRVMARRMWEHLFVMVIEVAHARRKIHPSTWRKHIELRDARSLVRRMLDERAKIIVSGHFGNFEVSGYVLGMFGFPTFSIARPLDNRFLDRFLGRFRGSTGQYILPKDGSAEQTEKLLRSGGALTLLGDQHANGRRGAWVNFFGRPAATHKAIALFSLASESPLAVSYCRRLERPLRFEIGTIAVADPIDGDFDLRTVPELTQWYTRQLETMINLAPEQYWWLHRRWKGTPPRRVLERLAA